jgi:hypothetical protein
MPNITRNHLIITGPTVSEILEYIGFITTIVDGHPVLIDLNRICAEPPELPADERRDWRYKHWGTASLYDGYLTGDIVELKADNVDFTFYTCWSPAYKAIKALAERFLDYRFHYCSVDETNHCIGEVIWKKGREVVFAPMFPMKTMASMDVPAYEPVTDELRHAAAAMIQSLQNNCPPSFTIDAEAVEMVARAMALSRDPVSVEFAEDDDGETCLQILVERLPYVDRVTDELLARAQAMIGAVTQQFEPLPLDSRCHVYVAQYIVDYGDSVSLTLEADEKGDVHIVVVYEDRNHEQRRQTLSGPLHRVGSDDTKNGQQSK